MAFAQFVIGPPGSGKTTYCQGMKEFLTAAGRATVIVNLDPANDFLPYECAVNIADLITVDDVMEKLELGPNGGLIHCIKYLEQNLDWLKDQLEPHKGKYILFDCPGQVELYTHDNSMRNIVQFLEKQQFRLCAVQLVDSHYCSDASKFISVLVTSLSTMLQLALPHINVLSKIDLVESYGELAFNLDFYTEVLDLDRLMLVFSEDPFFERYRKLNQALCDVIQEHSLVSFHTLDIQQRDSMVALTNAVDKANGYCFGSVDGATQSVFEVIAGPAPGRLEPLDIMERYNINDM